jgi:hypothetical protein
LNRGLKMRNDRLHDYYDEEPEDYRDEVMEDVTMFQDPGGPSALRRATPTNPRNLPCPDCGAENRLTPFDVGLGYCCNQCATSKEFGFDY